MSISRVKASGWGIGEKLTSSEMNDVDINPTKALDKRAGESDALMSFVVATGAGRVVDTVATGPDRDWTFHFGGNGPSGSSARIVRIPTLTAARSYFMGISGATGGDRVLFYYDGTGGTSSGYVDVKNTVGTALVRLGKLTHSSPNLVAEAESAEIILSASEWRLIDASPGPRSVEFVSTTTWVCPPGIFSVELYGWGGGGGGGGGAGVSLPGGTSWGGGGGGGGGATSKTIRVDVVPKRSYDVVIGAGGSGGSGGIANTFSHGAGNSGSNGGDTIFRETASGRVVARFPGAGAGAGGNVAVATHMFAFGRAGLTIAPPVSVVATGGVVGSGAAFITGWLHPGMGGMGSNGGVPTGLFTHIGMPSAEGYTGGTGAAFGANIAYPGGGPGGGGGAGPGGGGAPAGSGGDGGAGSGDSPGSPAPTGAAANTGAGGGGGGGGGQKGLANTTGGAGSAAGSGKLTLTMVK